jgi:glycosyltransferase involved in cell wall biosynthesis
MDKNTATEHSRIILPDVSLAAIVRDEIMNPAGGIVDFVESTVPFVERAVIVDTGSKDGTREALEELQSQYPHLVVLDRPFDDYATSRNFSLQNVKSKYAFVLDADERIKSEDFARLARIMRDCPKEGYNFRFRNRCTSYTEDHDIPGHNPRLFVNSGKFYYNNIPGMQEYLYDDSGVDLSTKGYCYDLHIYINHFILNRNIYFKKFSEWYEDIVAKGKASSIAPSDLPNDKIWKAYHPRREEFR